MRYELYECRDENTFMFLCEVDDFSQITQPFSKPNNENRQQYILLDNEGGNLIYILLIGLYRCKSKRNTFLPAKGASFCVSTAGILC